MSSMYDFECKNLLWYKKYKIKFLFLIKNVQTQKKKQQKKILNFFEKFIC